MPREIERLQENNVIAVFRHRRRLALHRHARMRERITFAGFTHQQGRTRIDQEMLRMGGEARYK